MRQGRDFRLYAWDNRAGATIIIRPGAEAGALQCDEPAENAVYVRDTRDTKEILRFNLKTQTTEFLANYVKTKSHSIPIISASPNAQYIAYRPSTIDPSKLTIVGNLKPLQVSGDGVVWKNNSSMLLTTIAPHATPKTNRDNYAQAIEVVHAETGKKNSGKLPGGYSFRNGAFVNEANQLLLFLKFFDDDFGNEDGVVFRCSLFNFRCESFVSNIRQASMNEGADIAVTKWIFNKPPPRSHDDSTMLPDRYVVQMIKRDSSFLPVAEFSSDVALDVNVAISPSGALAAITWIGTNSECQPRPGALAPCQMGALLDLNARSR
jgi:hypothetical protein